MSSKGIFNMKNIDYNILSNSLAIAHHRDKFIEGMEYLFANAYFNNIEKDGEIKSERELGLLTKKQKLDAPIKIDTTISFELYSILKNVDDVNYSYIFIDKEAFSRIRTELFAVLGEIRSSKEYEHGIIVHKVTTKKLGFALSRMNAIRVKIRAMKNILK